MSPRPSTAGDVLADAAEGLAAVEENRCGLDDFLDRELKHPEYRRTTGDLLFRLFRRKKQLEKLLSSLAERPPRPRVKRVLLAAFTQIFFQSAIAPESAVNVAVDLVKSRGGDREGNFVNALLRNALRKAPVFGDSPEEVLPSSLLRRWQARYSPGQLAQLAGCFLTEAPLTFRARGDWMPDGWDAKPIPAYGGFHFYSSPEPGKVIRSQAFADGKLYIQDPATSFAVSLVEDWSTAGTAIDVCGAPGGKALMLTERLRSGAKLTVNDSSRRRQLLTRENARRFRADWEIQELEADQLAGEYDLVLLDVPCSNTGVFRRRPDALWRFSEPALHSVAEKQKQILESACRLVAPGGRLLYSTCSLEPEENSGRTSAFCQAHPEWEIRAENQLLPSLERDGAFASLLCRRSE